MSVYNLTDKLNFEDNPKIKIKGKEYEVKADAETVLTLLELLKTKGEFEATMEAASILFSEKDLKAIKALKLSFRDYSVLLETAASLALGNDPDATESGEA